MAPSTDLTSEQQHSLVEQCAARRRAAAAMAQPWASPLSLFCRSCCLCTALSLAFNPTGDLLCLHSRCATPSVHELSTARHPRNQSLQRLIPLMRSAWGASLVRAWQMSVEENHPNPSCFGRAGRRSLLMAVKLLETTLCSRGLASCKPISWPQDM